MKILKNRLFIGCLCIIAAFAVGFIGIPKLMDTLNNKVTVVVAKSNITKGSELTANDFSMIQMSLGDIPYRAEDYYTSFDFIKDKTYYASIDMMGSDIITSAKISASKPYEDIRLRELSANEYAVSVSVGGLAESIAAKVQCGDIVSLMLYDEDRAFIDSGLMYMEVINVVNSDAADINSGEKSVKGIPSAVTFRANLRQALLLTQYQNSCTIHLALVCRGDDEKAQTLLGQQVRYFADNFSSDESSWYHYMPKQAAGGEQ